MKINKRFIYYNLYLVLTILSYNPIFSLSNYGLNAKKRLYRAIKNGQTKKVKYLIRHHPNFLHRGKFLIQGPPLIYALKLKKSNIANIILDYVKRRSDAQTYYRYINNYKTLYTTVINHNFDIAERLLKEGVNINVKNSEKYTTLITAASNANVAAVKFLIAHGADPKLSNEWFKTTPIMSTIKGYAKASKENNSKLKNKYKEIFFILTNSIKNRQ